MNRIAVAMSVYKNDRPKWLEAAIDSILCQTFSDFILFIAVDGEVGQGILDVLKKYEGHDCIRILVYSENLGLARRLNDIISEVLKEDFAFVARMDADDYSHANRFGEQVGYFEAHSEVDVLGAGLIEFNEVDDKLFNKRMPERHEDLVANIIKRCPFNHPTVMFRRSVFERTPLRYKSELKNTQDYYFWVDLLSEGFRFANISEPLLDFRVDSNFFKRRGGGKALNDFRARLYAMKQLQCRSIRNLCVAFALLGLRLSPSWVKTWAYRRLR